MSCSSTNIVVLHSIWFPCIATCLWLSSSCQNVLVVLLCPELVRSHLAGHQHTSGIERREGGQWKVHNGCLALLCTCTCTLTYTKLSVCVCICGCACVCEFVHDDLTQQNPIEMRYVAIASYSRAT